MRTRTTNDCLGSPHHDATVWHASGSDWNGGWPTHDALLPKFDFCMLALNSPRYYDLHAHHVASLPAPPRRGSLSVGRTIASGCTAALPT